MNEHNKTGTTDPDQNPHAPMKQLLALLLLASSDDGKAFTNLMPEAQRALLILAYEKALEASFSNTQCH